MTATTQCPHSDLDFSLNVVAFGDTNIRYLEIKGRCKICDQEIAFRGLPLGLTPTHPTSELGGHEARLPFMIGDEEYDGKSVGFVGRRVL